MLNSVLFLFYNLVFATLIAFSFVGCGEEENPESKSPGSTITTYTSSGTPVLKDFMVSIDENIDGNITAITSQSIGTVKVITEGGSNISSFRLEGRGFSNFSISKYGVINLNVSSDLNSTTTSSYSLYAIATNDLGDSNKANVLIQVNSLTQPVMKNYVMNINDSSSGLLETFTYINILRDGLGGTSLTNIKAFELSDTLNNNLSINSVGGISLTNSLGNSSSQYHLKYRAINKNDEVGPYSNLTINIINTGSNTQNTTNNNDDFPNDIYSANFTFDLAENRVAISLDPRMDYDYDIDAFRILIEVDRILIFELTSNNGLYSYARHNIDFIELYDNVGASIATYNGSNNTSSLLSAGIYYIAVSGASDSYKLKISR